MLRRESGGTIALRDYASLIRRRIASIIEARQVQLKASLPGLDSPDADFLDTVAGLSDQGFFLHVYCIPRSDQYAWYFV